jgi:hypothetical protein
MWFFVFIFIYLLLKDPNIKFTFIGLRKIEMYLKAFGKLQMYFLNITGKYHKDP